MGANPALTANRTYQAARDTLHAIENKAGTSVVSSYTYDVNSIGQREKVTTSGSAFAGVPANWDWLYDSLGQVRQADSPTVNVPDGLNPENPMTTFASWFGG